MKTRRSDTDKKLATEQYVERFIQQMKEPPTYAMIAEKFGIGRTAAYARCKRIRHKMVQQKKNS